MEKKKLKYAYLSAMAENLRSLLKSKNLTISQKIAIRDNINHIEDTTLGGSTKLGFVSQEFEIMRQHKENLEDADKMKKLINQWKKEIEDISSKEYPDIEFTFVQVNPDLLVDETTKDKDDKTIKIGEGYYTIILEYMGVIFELPKEESVNKE